MALSDEARYFHRAFFRQSLHPDVVDRYVKANLHCFPHSDAAAERTIAAILQHHVDVEAVEFALRMRKRVPRLTRKLQILFYLVEVRRDYYGEFVNETPGFVRGIFVLAGSILATTFKLVKGTWLVWRHRLG